MIRLLGRGVASLIDWGRAGLDMVAAGVSKVRGAVAAEPGDGEPDCAPVPIVILPGVLEPWRYLLPLGNWLAGRGHPVAYVERLGFNLHDLANSATRVVELLDERGLRDVVLVAHSKGGLIGKTVLLNEELNDRVLGMVTVSTPFAGSGLGGPLQRLPMVSRTPFGMFVTGSDTLLTLAEQRDVNERIVTMAPRWDQVTAPESTRLPGAKNVDFDGAGHFRPIRSPRVWAKIHDEVHDLVGNVTPRRATGREQE